MNNTALITTPSSDRTTRYISAWADKTIQTLKSKKFEFIILAKERAVPDIFESMVKKHKPSLIFLNGHGSSTAVGGHNNEILVKTPKNELLLRNSVTYALSCSSAKMLGPAAVKSGTVSYIGYEEDFIFFISPEKMSRPREDETAQMFIMPANHVIVSLIKGHTTGEATRAAKSYFYRSIQKLVSSESSIDEREYIRYLIWDMKNLVCHGNQDAKVVGE